MQGWRSIVSGIVLATLVAACGTMSAAEHRSAAQRYEEAARAARGRGDSTEAARYQGLAAKENGGAQAEEERTANAGDWAP